jgi:hypothetical protein
VKRAVCAWRPAAASTGGFFHARTAGRKEPGVDESDLLNCLKRRHLGRENAVKSPVLEARLGIRGAALRVKINDLRCNGQPICSDEFGYYYAKDEAELKATIRRFHSRIGKMAKARKGLVRATGRYADDGQIRLPL